MSPGPTSQPDADRERAPHTELVASADADRERAPHTELVASDDADRERAPHAELVASDDAGFEAAETEELESILGASSRNSRERRGDGDRPRTFGRGAARALVLTVLVATGAVAWETVDALTETSGVPSLEPIEVALESARRPPPFSPVSKPELPMRRGVHAANGYARSREGIVAFAVMGADGKVHDRLGARSFVSASVVKALLLVAELRRIQSQGLTLDDLTESTLQRMITVSDNAAADEIYGRVGDAGLERVADDAGMRDFTVDGYWANAQITADDMVGFADRLDALVRGPEAGFANHLLRDIVPYQRWGIPTAVGVRWRVRFKGGWRTTELGALAHQFARLDRDHDHLSLAVLTDGQPSQEYAAETIEGVAARLLVEPGAQE